ncbi:MULTISPECIES: NepR family anti-sigma factor [Rhizobium]|nr:MULTISPECIES: NepR family anti-sigma factor [Rhizobium]
MAAFHPGVSAQLREFYQSVQEEGIPQRFLELLERLDMAERRAEEGIQNREVAR